VSANLPSIQPLALEASKHAPSWRSVYLDALQAKGIERVTSAVTAAETAIFERWQEISGQPGDVQEREQLRMASEELLKIQQEKLNWPKPGATPGT
jgi:hypothetical protein